MEYDLVVIGGGPAGYTGAIRAAKLGMKTALVEKNDLGGTCLNRGCIPTKSLLFSAEMFDSRSAFAENGINIEGAVSFDEEKAYERKQKIVESLRRGIETLVKANGIDFYRSHATILGANAVRAGEITLKTRFILIATGSKPQGFDQKRPINGIEQALNSDDVLAAPVRGNNIIIIGGGVIACEFASYFSMAGKKVTMLVAGDRLLKGMSRDISSQLSASLKRQGIKIITGASAKRVTKTSVETDCGLFEGDAVLAAVGRAANLSDLGLESVGLSAEHGIPVDENMFTGAEGIYACGDVTDKINLAHYAAASAVVAVESMLKRPHSINMSVCPSCIYTRPEIAVVGNQADENDRVGKFPMGANGKALIDGMSRGYIKVIADSNGVIKGGEAFSLRATDLIGELALGVALGLRVADAAAVIHPHPTIMEAVHEAYEDVFGLATHII